MNWTDDELKRGRRAFAEEGGSCSITPVMDVTAELLAARGGTMTAERLRDWFIDREHLLLTRAQVAELRQHIATQGATVAALERDATAARAERDAAQEDVTALRAELARLKECPDLAEEFTTVRQALATSPVENVRPFFERIATMASMAARWKAEACDAALKPSGQVAVLLERVQEYLRGAEWDEDCPAYAAAHQLAALAQQGQEAMRPVPGLPMMPEALSGQLATAHPSHTPCVEGSCHHHDAGTPGHPERVAALSQAFNEATFRSREPDAFGLVGTPAHPDVSQAYDSGAEDMRAACREAAVEVLERFGFRVTGKAPLITAMTDAIDGATP